MNDEQIERLKLTLATSGWKDVIQVIYAQRGQALIKVLVQAPDQRSGEFKGASDDLIRGRLQEIEWTLTAWHNQIVNHEINRRQEEARNGSGTAPEPIQAPVIPGA